MIGYCDVDLIYGWPPAGVWMLDFAPLHSHSLCVHIYIMTD